VFLVADHGGVRIGRKKIGELCRVREVTGIQPCESTSDRPHRLSVRGEAGLLLGEPGS
jgi:hypothetical protein